MHNKGVICDVRGVMCDMRGVTYIIRGVTCNITKHSTHNKRQT